MTCGVWSAHMIHKESCVLSNNPEFFCRARLCALLGDMIRFCEARQIVCALWEEAGLRLLRALRCTLGMQDFILERALLYLHGQVHPILLVKWSDRCTLCKGFRIFLFEVVCFSGDCFHEVLVPAFQSAGYERCMSTWLHTCRSCHWFRQITSLSSGSCNLQFFRQDLKEDGFGEAGYFCFTVQRYLRSDDTEIRFAPDWEVQEGYLWLK